MSEDFENDSVFYYARSKLSPYYFYNAINLDQLISHVRNSFKSRHKPGDEFATKEVKVDGTVHITYHLYHV